ncbi:nitrogen fixation protein NifU and related proteins [Methylomarinovum caldicuralii]|uniref:Nitrogen fixation protein NifU and related proteins n=1 Tax=Methylomarinovum caldicuralii TaxID=438856 RepID=A0AAU9BZ47_9GAMM|nr:SUF system NifU family Fe-S cluster assembly protein [Methylomarinovum caldicuralii]BCX81610.1 nitrogen fixation protein NifU and related proteins [Methylomarinovum caldicuralii]
MLDDLRDLYQEVVFDHNRNPRNFRPMEDADRIIEGHNPLCGDRITLYLKLDGDRIADVSFQGQGCAISTASASLMTEIVKGKTLAEAEKLFDVFHKIVTGQDDDLKREELGKLAVLAGVRQYPSRIKCATLPWHSLEAAIKGEQEAVSTE